MKWPRLYLSGPITHGCRTTNFATGCTAHEELLKRHFAVYNPMLSMMHPNAWQISHDTWLQSDLAWVEVADVVLRLPGESEGADRECSYAATLDIPVVYSWAEALRWKELWEARQEVAR